MSLAFVPQRDAHTSRQADTDLNFRHRVSDALSGNTTLYPVASAVRTFGHREFHVRELAGTSWSEQPQNTLARLIKLEMIEFHGQSLYAAVDSPLWRVVTTFDTACAEARSGQTVIHLPLRPRTIDERLLVTMRDYHGSKLVGSAKHFDRLFQLYRLPAEFHCRDNSLIAFEKLSMLKRLERLFPLSPTHRRLPSPLWQIICELWGVVHELDWPAVIKPALTTGLPGLVDLQARLPRVQAPDQTNWMW